MPDRPGHTAEQAAFEANFLNAGGGATAPTAPPQPGGGQEGVGGQRTAVQILIDLLNAAGLPIPPELGGPQQPGQAGAPQQAAPLLTPAIKAAIEAIPGFAESGFPAEAFAPLLTQDPGGKLPPALDPAAFANIQKSIQAAATEGRKVAGEGRAGAKEERTIAKGEADAAAKAEQAKQEAAGVISPADAPRNLEALMTKAIVEGDFDLATRVKSFRDDPTNADKLRLAIDFATSPADAFVLSAVAQGVFPGQFDPKTGITSLPRPNFARDLFNETFGVSQDPFAGRQQPEDTQPAASPPPSSSFTPPVEESVGGSLLPPQTPEVSQPPLTQPAPQIGGGFFDPNQSFTGPGGSGVDPSRLGQLSPPPIPGGRGGFFAPGIQGTAPGEQFLVGADQPPAFNRRLTFPEDTGIIEPGPTPQGEPTPDPSGTSTQGTDQQRPLPSDRVLTPGVPTFGTTFDGQDLQLPTRFGTLFRGIKDPTEQLQRPQSFLGAVGLPRPSAGAFQKLSASEQDAFFGLARMSGLDPRDVQKELQSSQVRQPRFSRITSAAGRA